MSIGNDVYSIVERTRKSVPIVHCISNYVTVSDCANVLLAVGASPIMADDIREMGDIVSVAQGLCLNIGTLNGRLVDSMLLAGETAKGQGKPIVLDPVGAGASRLRDETVGLLVSGLKPDIIRGNMSEIKAVHGSDCNTQGVDVSQDDIVSRDNLSDSVRFIDGLSRDLGATVVSSGAIDIVGDGVSVYSLFNGDVMLPRITGSGCMLSSIIGAYSCVADPLLACVAGLTVMGVAGENAASKVRSNGEGIGSFKMRLFDEIYSIEKEDILNKISIQKEL